MFLWKQLHQDRFDFDRVAKPGKPEPAADAPHVCVDHHTSWFVESSAEDDVGRLAAHPRERDEILHPIRNAAAEAVEQTAGHPEQAFRLVAEKTGRLDEFLDLTRIGHGERFSVGVSLEQRRRHQIHAFVGTLCAENGSGQELVRTGVIQLAVGIRVRPLETFEDQRRTH